MKIYFVEITPLVHLPRTAVSTFTYFSDKKISRGALVLISFRNRRVRGIVRACRTKKPTYETKKIFSLISPNPFFTNKEIQLIENLAQYYICHVSEIFKLFIPTRLSIKSLKSIISNSRKTTVKRNAPMEIYLQQTLKRDITRLKNNILSALTKKQQVLFLVPTLPQLLEAKRELEKCYPGADILTVHSKLSAKELGNILAKITSSQNCIIVSLRHGIFSPFLNLGLIIHYDGDHAAYTQWDLHPKYSTTTVLEIRNTLLPTHTIKLVAFPAHLDWYAINKKKIILRDEPGWAEIKNTVFIERKPDPANFHPLHDTIQRLYGRTGESKRWLFFLNRKGLSRFIVCKDCSWEARCPKCDLMLVQITSHQLRCSRCEYTGPLPITCPVCNGTYVKQFGVGIESLTRFVKDLPGGCSPLLLDSNQDNVSHYFTARSVIATDTIFSFPSRWDFDYIVMVNADSERSLPHWNAEDKFISKVWKLQTFKKREGTLYLQTAHPQDVGSLFVKRRAHDTIINTLKIKKRFFYPPFGEILLLTKKLKPNSPVDTPKKLQKFLMSAKKCTYSAKLITNKRGRWHTIIIRTHLPSTSFKKKLYDIVPSEWYIEINPL